MLVFVAEAHAVVLGAIIHMAGIGHYGYVRPVATAGAAQVQVAEAGNGGVYKVIAAAPVPAFGAIVGAELHHTKGYACTRESMAMATCADEGVDVAGELLRMRGEGRRAEEYKKQVPVSG